MKKLVFLFVSLFVVVVATENVSAQNPTASASATANATIIEAISITQQQDLHFGNIIADADGGTVIIASDGIAAPQHVGIKSPNLPGLLQHASFKVKGLAGVTYNIELPSSVIIEDDGGNNMIVNNFTSNYSGTITGGEVDINVGATLNVKQNQASGDYSGSFEVKVAYN